MTNVLQLTEDYILARDLRRDTETIYRRSARVLLEHFGTTPIEEMRISEHRDRPFRLIVTAHFANA